MKVGVFCAGQDLGDRAAKVSDEGPSLGDSIEKYYNPLIRAIMTMEKPVICAVNGVAAGAGASIALACDIVVLHVVPNLCKRLVK